MHRFAQVSIVSVLFLAALGCVEKKQKVTLNPDGSGKTELDMLVAAPMSGQASVNGNAAPQPSPRDQLKATVGQMISSSKGVDAWKDVTCELAEDGRFHVTGVAYFRDYNSFQIQAGNVSSNLKGTWGKDDNGGMRLSLGERPAAAAPTPRTDAEVAQALAQIKTQWQQSRAMASAFLANLKEDSTFVLPGKVTDAGALEQVPGGVRLVIDGQKILAAMDALMSDEARLTAQLKAGRDPLKDMPDDPEIEQAVFGRPGQPVAKVGGELKPLFEYDREMRAAKAAMPAMLQKLGLTAPPPAEPAGGN